MTQSFFAQLDERARHTGSLLCVGLDPHAADLPQPNAAAARDFCLRLIKATQDLALAYKPNAAFFEVFGADGWKALQDVIAAVPEGIPVVLDAKRGDISSTAEAYAQSVFEVLKAHAVTLSPYMGYDSLHPFLKEPAHGGFLLCKTSNPGTVDLQDLSLVAEGRPLRLYEKVAMLAQEWNTNNNVGLVVGATHPDALKRVRQLVPDLWILAPGVGAQGADLETALSAGLRSDGLGLLVPVSRALSRAADPRQAAQDLNEQMRRARESVLHQPARLAQQTRPLIPRMPFANELAEGLLRAGCVRFGQFTLKSGIVSPIYIDLRQLASYPDVLAEAAAAYVPLLRKLTFSRLAALPYAALPIATAISLQSGWSMIYPRKEAKSYGTRADIEGEFQSGEQVVVIDDLITTGSSKFEAIEKLTQAGLVVKDVVVLIDRQSGASDALGKAGIRLHAVLKMTDLLNFWESTGRIPAEQIQNVRTFLKSQS